MTQPSGSSFQPRNLEWQTRLQGVPLASFRARALAFLIDGAIVGLMSFAPSIWTSLAVHVPGEAFTLDLDFGALFSVVVAILYFGLSTYLGKGATLGKRVFGIRVVSLVESELSLWHSIERALGYAASSLEAGFGFLQFFTHPNRQTVHDRIAETIVIADRSPTMAAAAS